MKQVPILHVPTPRINKDADDLLRGHGIDIRNYIPHFLSSQNPTGGWHDYWDGLGNEMEEVIEDEKEEFFFNGGDDNETLRKDWAIHEEAMREELASAISMCNNDLINWVNGLPCGKLIVGYPAYEVEESHVENCIIISPCDEEI